MAIQERGDAGYLEKGGHRIMIDQWCIHDDNSLILISSDESIYKMDKKLQDTDQNPIFIASNTPWHLTKGTKIVMLLPKVKESAVSPKGKEAIVLDDTKCNASGKSKKSEDGKITRIMCIRFDNISAWKIEPHNS